MTVYNHAGLGIVAREELPIRLPQRYFVSDITVGRSMGPQDLVCSSITVGGTSGRLRDKAFETTWMLRQVDITN